MILLEALPGQCDDQLIRYLFLLEMPGFSALSASRGEEALDLSIENREQIWLSNIDQALQCFLEALRILKVIRKPGRTLRQ